MSRILRPARLATIGLAIALLALGRFAAGPSRADTVLLNNGVVYRGLIDKDKPLVWVYDGVKRVVVRDSKIKSIESDQAFRTLEKFTIDQPLVVHGGVMPKEVLSVDAAPWNDRGRRNFTFEGTRPNGSKVYKTSMQQAINVLGVRVSGIRGVDGFWQGSVDTGQIPREIVLAILAKVDQTDKNERLRVARFLIQAEWYAEAVADLARISKDFPDDADLKERVKAVLASVHQLQAVQVRAEIDRKRAAQQPKGVTSLLKTFPTEDVANDLLSQVRELERTDADQASDDQAVADDLRALSGKIPADASKSWEKPLLEVLRALKEAPDAVRDRLAPWKKAQADGGKTPEALFAQAMSGYVVGADAAVEDLALASTYWTMRDQVRAYLGSREETARGDLLSKLDATILPATPDIPEAYQRLDIVTKLAVHMTPPLHESLGAKDVGSARIRRVRDDDSEEPTEYTVVLPPEYHPLRSYPAIVALHDGKGPDSAIAWWSTEASKRGYIVIAPEYAARGKGKEYGYSPDEHAAVELAIRDAKRRYAIDSDRVFLGGVLVGANMAWDFGLAHPDLFAGVIPISGLPFKYANRYIVHADMIPLYVVEGDLAPAASELVYGQLLKPLIANRAWDILYVEYMKRGLESFPEEVGPAFDWMERRRRDTYPKTFNVMTARDSDVRFYGVVVRELVAGRSLAPEAVDPTGKNLTPATIKVTSSLPSNLLNLTVTGVKSMDVWVSPKLLDLKKKVEVRVTNPRRTSYRVSLKPDLIPLLEDLRIRGDRQQIYWMKVPVGYRPNP